MGVFINITTCEQMGQFRLFGYKLRPLISKYVESVQEHVYDTNTSLLCLHKSVESDEALLAISRHCSGNGRRFPFTWPFSVRKL